MINLLAKIFIKDSENTSDPAVRNAWGLLCSIVTIGLNVIVFIAKYLTGLIAGSVSIMADSFNNLSDAGSSILILFGFKFAGIKPTPERPFGHGRIEYVVGLIVSVLIMFVGYTTLLEAIDAIKNPSDVTFSILTIVILVLSIAIKFYMAGYGKSIGNKIDSQALKASASENMTDTISTALTLISLLLNHFLGWQLDGWAALIVSILLLKAGIENAWETLKDLLGKKADPELVEKVKEICMSYEEIVGIHDLIIHDYGPSRLYISLHCEVPGNKDVYVLHDAMDRAMVQLDKELNCESVIHMDPINVDDGITQETREKLTTLFKENIDSEISIHDFRIVPGPTHTSFIFDALVPIRFKLSDEEVEKQMKDLIKAAYPDKTILTIITIDKPYA